jgi:hypothetical protein
MTACSIASIVFSDDHGPRPTGRVPRAECECGAIIEARTDEALTERYREHVLARRRAARPAYSRPTPAAGVDPGTTGPVVTKVGAAA